MFDLILFIAILWGLFAGICLERNWHRLGEIFFTHHQTHSSIGYSDAPLWSLPILILLLFLAPHPDALAIYDPFSDYIYTRLITLAVMLGLGFGLRKWAKSEGLV